MTFLNFELIFFDYVVLVLTAVIVIFSFWKGFINSVFLRSKAKHVISSLSLSAPQFSFSAIESTTFLGVIVSRLDTISFTPSAPSSWPFFKYPSVTPSV